MEDRQNPIPVVTNGLVFVGYRDRTLHALDAHTGQKKWEFGRVAPCTKAVAGEDSVYVAGRRSLFALEVHTGLVRWESDNIDGWPDASLTLAYGRIYVVAGNVLYAFHSGTGQTVWQATVGAVNASVVAFRNKVYVTLHDET